MTGDQFPPEARIALTRARLKMTAGWELEDVDPEGMQEVLSETDKLLASIAPFVKPRPVVTDDTVQAVREVLCQAWEEDMDDPFTDTFEYGARAVLSSGLVVTRAEYDQVLAQLDKLNSWRGMIELLAEHWPADIFGDGEGPLNPQADPGVQIIHLIRALDQVSAREEALRQAVRELAERWRHDELFHRAMDGNICAAELRALLDPPEGT